MLFSFIACSFSTSDCEIAITGDRKPIRKDQGWYIRSESAEVTGKEFTELVNVDGTSLSHERLLWRLDLTVGKDND